MVSFLTRARFFVGNPWPPVLHSFNATDVKMSSIMGSYWTSFAASGVPRGGSVTWPAYTTAAQSVMTLNFPPRVLPDSEVALCDFWNTIQINQ